MGSLAQRIRARAGSSRASFLQADAAGGAEEAVAGDEPPKPKVLELLNSAACAWPPSLAQPQAGAPAATSALRYARRRKKGLRRTVRVL